MHSSVDGKDISILHGSGKKRLKLFQEKSDKPHIFITNYESLLMEDLWKAFYEWQPEVVIWDEVHKLKDHTSKRSKLADKLVNGRMGKDGLGPRPNVYILSGSPVLNSSLDLFMQYKVLDGGKTFGSNFYQFRARYFRDKNAGMPKQNYFPNWVPIGGAADEISKKIEPTSMRVLKKDCMDLPDFVRQTILVEMSDEQRKIYNAMMQDFVAYFQQDGKEHVASAQLAITKALKLMQIASGYIKTVDEKEVNIGFGFNEKQKVLYELLEELTPSHKVIIWAVWKQNYEQIREVVKKLKLRHVEIHGDIPQKDKMDAVDLFSNDSSFRVLLGHPGSGGIGVNLIQASYSIFYSRTFSLEHDLQAEARNYRGGSKELHNKVTRIDLVTKDSIEEKIVEALKNKEAVGVDLLKRITLAK